MSSIMTFHISSCYLYDSYEYKPASVFSAFGSKVPECNSSVSTVWLNKSNLIAMIKIKAMLSFFLSVFSRAALISEHQLSKAFTLTARC